jgi:hypothetical protein
MQMLSDSIIHFGENLPEEDLGSAYAAAHSADLCLALGSSLKVTPASDIPKIVGEKGGLVIVNLQPTPLDDLARLLIRAKVDDVLRVVMAELRLDEPAAEEAEEAKAAVTGASSGPANGAVAPALRPSATGLGLPDAPAGRLAPAAPGPAKLALSGTRPHTKSSAAQTKPSAARTNPLAAATGAGAALAASTGPTASAAITCTGAAASAAGRGGARSGLEAARGAVSDLAAELGAL